MVGISAVQALNAGGNILEMGLELLTVLRLAFCSRGTPRIANRLLKRVRDYAEVHARPLIDDAMVAFTLEKLDIDNAGLERMDRQILAVIRERYDGGPVGLDTLAATIGEERSTIEEVFEPYLVHIGFLSRGPRGRSLTPAGRKHLENSRNS